MTETTVTSQTSQNPRIDFWFDPSCPWAWMTSRWMTEVIEQRGVDVTWHILSLAVLNEGRDLSEDYREMIDKAWTGAQAFTGVGEELGQETLAKLYTAVGTRFHPGGRTNERAALVEAFEEVGVDTAFLDRAEAGEFDEAMRASTKKALDLVGDDVGVPVVAFDGTAFFGPVVTPAPKGQDALDMFDGLALMAKVDGFYELKRSRDKGPQFD